MSGTMSTPALGEEAIGLPVTGPFRALDDDPRAYLMRVVAGDLSSRAAGTSTSTSMARSPAFEIGRHPARPSRVRDGYGETCSIARATSMPSGAV